jgi:hypothetical protein
MRPSHPFKFMPGLFVIAFLVSTVYPIRKVNGEVYETTFMEMKRAAPIEGFLSHAQVHAIRTHCQELDTHEQYVNAIQRYQYKLIRFYQWICAGFR